MKPKTPPAPKRSLSTVKLPPYLALLLDKFMEHRKTTEPYTQTKQYLITKAIEEKLKSDANKIKDLQASLDGITIHDSPKKSAVFINDLLNEKIQKHLDVLRKTHDPSISKNSWITKAILELIERDPNMLEFLRQEIVASQNP